MDNYRLAYLLEQEAMRHVRLASITDEPIIAESHREVAFAQIRGATLLRKEAKSGWQACPKLDRRKRLRLTRLKLG